MAASANRTDEVAAVVAPPPPAPSSSSSPSSNTGDRPAAVDIISVYATDPLSLPHTSLRIVHRLRQLYGRMLQPVYTECFENALAQRDPVSTRAFFFMMLCEEEFVTDMVRTCMPRDKLARFELFLRFVRVKYGALSRVHARVDNIAMLFEAYTIECSMAWTCNRVAYMQRCIADAERDYPESTESTADIQANMEAAAAAAAAATAATEQTIATGVHFASAAAAAASGAIDRA